MPVDDLPWAVSTIRGRRPYYKLHRDYYEGRHRLEFATPRFRSTFGVMFESFRDNLCPPVVNAMVDRLQLTSWASAGATDVGDAASAIWTANRNGRQGQVHLAAARSGDAYTLVWPARDATPRIWPQEPHLMAVDYDDEDDPERIRRAAKLWQREDKRWRLNLYTHREAPSSAEDTPGLVERFVTKARTDDLANLHQPHKWEPFEGDEQGPEVEHPWGVPVFHYPNNAPVGHFGSSELQDVVPLQDALNKTVADLLVAGEFVALPQRVLIGVEKEVDPLTGMEVKLEPGADRLWRITNAQGQAVQFPAADLGGFLQVLDSFRVEIARVSGTSPQELQLLGSTANLSGEALQNLEGRQTKKCTDRIEEWTPVHRAEMQLACRQAGVTDRLELLEPVWDDPATRSELLMLTAAEAKLRVGYSKRQVLRELGKSDDEIEAMEGERQTEAEELGEALLGSFDRGGSAFPVAVGE